jgi:hypothetical protein
VSRWLAWQKPGANVFSDRPDLRWHNQEWLLRVELSRSAAVIRMATWHGLRGKWHPASSAAAGTAAVPLNRIASASTIPALVDEGGLMSYHAVEAELYRRARGIGG